MTSLHCLRTDTFEARRNFSYNLLRNSFPKRCRLVTNVGGFKNILATCDRNMHLPILNLRRVELRCKLHETIAPCVRAVS